jgi:hypothetical protein
LRKGGAERIGTVRRAAGFGVLESRFSNYLMDYYELHVPRPAALAALVSAAYPSLVQLIICSVIPASIVAPPGSAASGGNYYSFRLDRYHR